MDEGLLPQPQKQIKVKQMNDSGVEVEVEVDECTPDDNDMEEQELILVQAGKHVTMAQQQTSNLQRSNRPRRSNGFDKAAEPVRGPFFWNIPANG